MLMLVVGFGSLGTVVESSDETLSVSRSDLVLSIEVDSNQLQLFEPVTVIYRVTNPTTETITANVVMLQAAGRIEFRVTGPDGETTPYQGSRTLSVVGRETQHEPGSILVSEADLDRNSTHRMFPNPGTYQIQARMRIGPQPVPVWLESNSVEIQFNEPSGINAEAIQFFSDEDEFLRLLRGGAWAYCRKRGGSSCYQEISTFIKDYSASVYAPQITWNLAEAIAHGGIDVTPKFDLAIETYQYFLTEWPDHPSAARVMYGLAFTLRDAGETDEAARVAAEYAARFPDDTDRISSLISHLE
jgi:hypothetical protein